MTLLASAKSAPRLFAQAREACESNPRPESESPTKSKLLRGADGEESRGQYLERELSQLDVAITLPDMANTHELQKPMSGRN